MLVKTAEGAEIDVNLDDHSEAVKTHLEGKGILLKSKEELEAERKTVETTVANETTKKLLDHFDSVFEGVFEGKKPGDVKSIDWAAAEAKRLKELANKKPDPAPAPGTNVELDKLTGQLTSTKTELEQLKASIEKEKSDSANNALKAAQRSGIKALAIAGDTPEEIKENVDNLDVLIAQRYRKAFDEEGDVVFYDGDNIVTDPETGGKPMKIDKLVQVKFKNYLKPAKEEPKPTGGTGTKQEAVLEKTASGKEGIKAKSRDEIRQEAWKKGMTMGSKDYNEFMAASLELSGLQ